MQANGSGGGDVDRQRSGTPPLVGWPRLPLTSTCSAAASRRRLDPRSRTRRRAIELPG